MLRQDRSLAAVGVDLAHLYLGVLGVGSVYLVVRTRMLFDADAAVECDSAGCMGCCWAPSYNSMVVV